jgi:hypothetical protein
MKFSDRIGLTKPKDKVQVNLIDNDLKISLWNVINLFINQPFLLDFGTLELRNSNVYFDLFHSIWYNHFKITTDYLYGLSGYRVVSELKEQYDKMEYYDIYNFIEFIAQEPLMIPANQRFVNEVNVILKRELSGYRFVGNKLVPITNETEISQLEHVLEITSSNQLEGVNIHLKEALNKFSDRKNPDYRNSIKESISALEALCQMITGNNKADLGKALSTIKKTLPIHVALIEGFIKIYGYTSDGDGIRHALLEETTLDQEDALYMLVSCSAFINYLIIKSDKASIRIK